jgi:hypothetical protein
MKKLILLIIVVVLACFAGYKLFFNKESKPPEIRDESLPIGANSTSFDSSFSKLMSHYYDVKDALVDWDTAKANKAAALLEKQAGRIPLDQLKADSNIVATAQNFATSISTESNGFRGETTIEEKRRAFNMLTDEVYNLIRTVRYSGGTVYHIKCPMAFNDSEEAYWLSSSNKVINPYLGNKHPKYNDKMAGCGIVVDSLDFAKK